MYTISLISIDNLRALLLWVKHASCMSLLAWQHNSKCQRLILGCTSVIKVLFISQLFINRKSCSTPDSIENLLRFPYCLILIMFILCFIWTWHMHNRAQHIHISFIICDCCEGYSQLVVYTGISSFLLSLLMSSIQYLDMYCLKICKMISN